MHANHSNFPECDDCRDNRLEKLENIRLRRPASFRQATRAKQVAHLQEVHAERSVASDLKREASRNPKMVFGLSDKLGSRWNDLPMPADGRDSKKSSGRWKYRQGVQGNSYPGVGNFFSWVPPNLHTGNNFGVTSLCVSLHRLISQGKLTAGEYFALVSDGGSDNVGWITHAMNFVLVREGVFNTLDWLRLRPGHSHNEQDLAFSRAKAIFYPHGGIGPGCSSPMEYYHMLTKGLREMPGGLEVLWQLANFDFSKYCESFFEGKTFAHHRKYRYWRYEYVHPPARLPRATAPATVPPPHSTIPRPRARPSHTSPLHL